jgi:hypothetical protein
MSSDENNDELKETKKNKNKAKKEKPENNS